MSGIGRDAIGLAGLPLATIAGVEYMRYSYDGPFPAAALLVGGLAGTIGYLFLLRYLRTETEHDCDE